MKGSGISSGRLRVEMGAGLHPTSGTVVVGRGDALRSGELWFLQGLGLSPDGRARPPCGRLKCLEACF